MSGALAETENPTFSLVLWHFWDQSQVALLPNLILTSAQGELPPSSTGEKVKGLEQSEEVKLGVVTARNYLAFSESSEPS